MPQKYLFSAFSKPLKVSNEVWDEWYVKEHVPDLVNHNVSKTGAIYQAVPNPLGYAPPDDKQYLALYQTDFERCLESEEYKRDVRKTSDLLPDNALVWDVAEFDLRNYVVADVENPKGVGEGPAKFLLWAEIDPPDVEEVIKFYKEEHTRMFARHPGWRRQIRLEPGVMELGAPKNPAPFVVIHEFDNFEGMGGPISEAAATTERAQKLFGGVKSMQVRTFKLLGSQGF